MVANLPQRSSLHRPRAHRRLPLQQTLKRAKTVQRGCNSVRRVWKHEFSAPHAGLPPVLQ